MVYNTTQHPPSPSHSHTLSVNTAHLLWEGGGVREKVEGQQKANNTQVYSSFVHGATVHTLGRKYQPWVNVSPVYKICETNAAKSVNRSISKKSRHLGFGVFIVHSSMILVKQQWNHLIKICVSRTPERVTNKCYLCKKVCLFISWLFHYLQLKISWIAIYTILKVKMHYTPYTKIKVHKHEMFWNTFFAETESLYGLKSL